MDPAEAETLTQKVIAIVAKQFATSKDKITQATSFQNDLAADSLDTVELVMELEDGLGVEFADQAVEQIKTVGDVIDYVLKVQAPPKKD